MKLSTFLALIVAGLGFSNLAHAVGGTRNKPEHYFGLQPFLPQFLICYRQAALPIVCNTSFHEMVHAEPWI